MKIKHLHIVTLLLFFYFNSIAGEEVVYRGIYQGKDLFIMNPMLDAGTEYCVTEISINDIIFNDVLNSSAFRISLDLFDLEYGEAYELKVKHHKNCKPSLVNPEVLKPLSMFDIIDYSISFDDHFKFTTENESGKLKFYLEEFRWGRWVDSGEINGKGGPNQNTYSVKVYPINGINKFRVYQMDHLYRRNYSDEINIEYTKDPVVLTSKLKKVKKNISFSGETMYIITNDFGEEVIKGYGKEIDVSGLEKGTYFLNYETEFTSFRKK